MLHWNITRNSKRRFQANRFRLFGIAIVLAILTVGSVNFGTGFVGKAVNSHQHSFGSIAQVSYYPMTRSYMGLPYDEQSGMTFTQSFSSLTFNVTAVSQTGPDGDGPAYLLSGLSDQYYWYQVGLSYKWPDNSGGHLPGFTMSYEVFDAYPYSNQYGVSIYPVGGGGGIENFTAPVNAGDRVLLTLSFNGANVTMSAHDWTTGGSASQTYFGFTGSYFMGTPNTSLNGFFTGLMTEQYFSSPSHASGTPVVYSDMDFNYTSATLWLDEWVPSTGQSVFSAQTNGAVALNSTLVGVWPAYLTSNGTTIAASQHEFATGLKPLGTFTANLSSPSIIHAGDSIFLNLTVQNPDQTNARLTDVSLTSDFGTSRLPDIDFSAGNSNHSIQTSIPSSTSIGSRDITLAGTLEVYEPQLNAWLSYGAVETTTLLTVSSPQQPAGLAQTLQSFFPEIIGIVAIVAIVVVGLVVALSRRKPSGAVLVPATIPQTVAFCPRCGQRLIAGMMFCPNCGNSLGPPTTGQSAPSTPPAAPPA